MNYYIQKVVKKNLFVGFVVLFLLSTSIDAQESTRIKKGGQNWKKQILKNRTADGTTNRRIGNITAGLQCLLRTNKNVYKLNEPILADFSIYNGGQKPVNVYAEFGKEGWLVMFELRVPKTGEIVYQSSPIRMTKRKMSDSLYFSLSPGATIGRIYQIYIPGKPFPPGEYELQAGYTNSYETCLASLHFKEEDIANLGRRAFVRLWNGQILSQSIPILIKKGKWKRKNRKW